MLANRGVDSALCNERHVVIDVQHNDLHACGARKSILRSRLVGGGDLNKRVLRAGGACLQRQQGLGFIVDRANRRHDASLGVEDKRAWPPWAAADGVAQRAIAVRDAVRIARPDPLDLHRLALRAFFHDSNAVALIENRPIIVTVLHHYGDHRI